MLLVGISEKPFGELLGGFGNTLAVLVPVRALLVNAPLFPLHDSARFLEDLLEHRLVLQIQHQVLRCLDLFADDLQAV